MAALVRKKKRSECAHTPSDLLSLCVHPDLRPRSLYLYASAIQGRVLEADVVCVEFLHTAGDQSLGLPPECGKTLYHLNTCTITVYHPEMECQLPDEE